MLEGMQAVPIGSASGGTSSQSSNRSESLGEKFAAMLQLDLLKRKIEAMCEQ